MNKLRFPLSFLFLILLLHQTHSHADTFGGKSENRPWHEKKRYAFLVGINKYKNTTELKYAVKDSKEMYKLFTQVGHFEKIFMLNDEDGKIIVNKGKVESRDKQYLPTKKNIEETYKSILTEKPDTLVFYYSGHGFIDGKDDKNSIAPMDVEVNFENDKAIAKNGIVITEMANGFKTEADKDKSEIDQVIFLIDACRSPLPKADAEEIPNTNKKELTKEDKSKAVNTGKPEPSKETPTEVSKQEPTPKLISFQNYGEEIPPIVNDAKGVVILIGTSPNQASLEDESIQSGKFTYYIRKAISGGIQDETPTEYVTLESLELFVKKKFDLEQNEYDSLYKEEIGEVSQGKTKQAIYKLSTQRGFTGDFLITYGRPPETEVRVERRGYMDITEERPVAAKVLFNKNKERYDLKFFAKSKDTGKYYPESLEGISRIKYDFDRTKTGDLQGFTAEQFNYKEESVYTHGLELDEENGWEFTSLYPLTEEDKKDKDKRKIRFQRQKFDFNGNNTLQEYFDDAGNHIGIGNTGITKTIRAWDYNGEKTLEEFYNGYGILTNNDSGYARYTASYLGKGKPVSEEFFDSEGNLSGNQTGIARKTYTYDRDYKLVSQQNFDKEGKRIGDKDGVAVTNYTYNYACVNRIWNLESAKDIYKNAENKAKSELTEKFKRKETYNDCIETEIYLDKSEKPKAKPNGIAKKENQFHWNGLKILEQYFRHDERPWHKAGIFRTVYEYDDKDRVISKRYFGETRNASFEPVPVTDERGIHEYRYQYGTTGGGKYQFGYKKELLERVTYHAADGKLVSTAEGISMEEHLFTYNRERKDYEEAVVNYLDASEGFVRADKTDIRLEISDENNNALFFEFLDSTGKLKEDEMGGARYVYYFTKHEKGENVVVVPYRADGNTAGNLYNVVKAVYEYDERGNMILKERYDAEGKLKNGDEYGVARFVSKYDEKGNFILYESYDQDGKLKNQNEYGTARLVIKYNEKGNQILEEYYGVDEKLVGEEYGIARRVYKYNENGNLILDETYGIDEKLVGDGQGIARKIYDYDEKGNMILFENYGVDGNLTEDNEYTARTIYKYDSKGNDILTEKYMANGELIMHFLNAKTISEYDSNGNIIKEESYRANGDLGIRTIFQYNSKNQLIETSSYNANWELFENVFYDNMAKIIYEYDENGNKVLEEFYGADGNLKDKDKFAKSEFQYDNSTRTALDQEFSKEWKLIHTTLMEAVKEKDFKGNQLSIEKQISFWKEKDKLEKKLTDSLGKEKGKKLFNNFQDFATKYTKELEKCTLRNVTYKADGTLVERKERFDRNRLLTTEKPYTHGVIDSPEYHLYFPNPRGQFEKRLLHMKLDRFYRPMGLEFEKR